MVSLIESYLGELKLNGFREGTIKGISKVLNRLNKFKPLEKCTAEDIKNFLSQGEKCKNTVTIYKVYIRKFFIWYGKPELVGWIKTKIEKKKLDENALLTNEEIKKLLETAYHPRDKVLIALLSETGARISELLSLDISDLKDTDYGMVIRIPDKEGNKTGSRPIPCIDSVPYIKAWLNQYPKPVTPDKPFLISFNQRTRFERLSYEGAWKIIKKIAKESGIAKRIHPHLFRHTQFTDMARQGYNESIIRKKAGWTGDSKMVDIYIQTSNKDVETAILAKHGLRHIQQAAPQIQLTKECPQCHKAIPVEAQYCENCSKHQDLTSIVRRSLEENAELKAEIETMKAMFNEDAIKAMIEARVSELMKKS